MPTTHDIVQKLWSLCHTLRDDGITYHQYVTELTLLLFLKMANEVQVTDARGKSGLVEERLPKGYRWDDLKAADGVQKLNFYRKMLLELGQSNDRLVAGIYSGASTSLREPKHLEQLAKDLDALDWYSAREDGLGNLYEGLLEKNANETKSGAGQYFTPRPLIETIVALVKPQPGEVIQDPAAGTGGFLIAANEHIRKETNDFFDLSSKDVKRQKQDCLVGVELVPETRRLALMNCMLHGIEGPPGTEGSITLGDSLSSLGEKLSKVNVILTNPPFGTKRGGGGPTRDFTYPTSNKQLAFLQHIYRGLKEGGRAAVVLPDNVLFEEGVGRQIRADLMDKCDLHTILRLPTGIFYAQGVKTNVLFFTRGESDTGNTKAVWVYDLRANMPSFGKRTPFTREALLPFEKAFGNDPLAKKSKRKDEGESGRFRKFTREEIRQRGDNLDIAWLKDESAHDPDDLREPEVLAAEIREELKSALEEIDALTAILAGDEEEAAGVAA